MLFLLLFQLEGPLFVKGSSTLFPVISSIANDYEKETGRSIQVSKWGSNFGVQFALSGEGIGMSSRPLSGEEIAKGARPWHIGKGRIVLLVHPENPVYSLTQTQVHDIFTGKIRQWSEIRHDLEGPIELLSLSERHGTTDYWRQKYPGENQISTEASFLTHDALQLAVSKNPNALGWSSLNLAESQDHIKMLEIEGHHPQKDTNDYPFERVLILVTQKKPPQKFLDFIAFVKRPQNKIYFEQYGLLFAEL